MWSIELTIDYYSIFLFLEGEYYSKGIRNDFISVVDYREKGFHI